MAILVSPGESITVTDESMYVSGAVGSVPLVVLATAQDKVYNGSVAAGTTKAKAGTLQAFTSQRDLISAFGQPKFQFSSAGLPLNASEINEYGLFAAYSALGVGNQLYAIRADVDLNQLVATNDRPLNSPANGAYWLNLNNTTFGLNVWNYTTGAFSTVTPINVTQASQVTLNGSVTYPTQAVGSIGSYAVVYVKTDGTQEIHNRLFYKATANSYTGSGNLNNQWVQVGSSLWQQAVPAVAGTVVNPTIPVGSSVHINGVTVTQPSGPTTLAAFVATINSANIPGVNAAVSTTGTLLLFVTSASTSGYPSSTTPDGSLVITDGTNTPFATTGIDVTKTYNAPLFYYGSYAQAPSWRSTDTHTAYLSGPTPTGSLFLMTTVTGGGADVFLEQFNATTNAWNQISVPLFASPKDAIYGLDPNGGGLGIAANSVFAAYKPDDSSANVLTLYTRTSIGPTSVTGTTPPNSSSFTTGNSFTIKTTAPLVGNAQLVGSGLTTYTVTLAGTDANAFVAAISAANIPYVSAQVNSNGTITISHATGGDMVFANVSGTPLTTAGFTSATPGLVQVNTGLRASNWVTFDYSVGVNQPYVAPASGTYWYYGDATTVDIMINDNGWKGYKNVSSDARGYNLTVTDPMGVIVSASMPTTQTDNTALVAGDLWLNTEDLANYPALSRYNGNAWVSIDNTDHTSENGVIFFDARWDTSGTTDIVEGNLPDTVAMLTSNYLDLDAPNYKLYPRGALLFNTRRSGFNVKKYVPDYFNATTFQNESLPTVTNAWVSASGYDNKDVAWFGSNAQRSIVTGALKAAVDSNTQIREDQTSFNLITCPGYPELIPNMVNLNNDKANRAFVIGDTPMTLAPNVVDIDNWSNDTDGNGLGVGDPYLAVYYPCAQTNDLSGNSVVVPASHMMLRTFLYNDQVSYQWFAPAGVHRGLISNVNDIGYVDINSGEFVHNSINQGLRDALYQTNINPITLLPGVGIVAWGQKTRSPVVSSMDRVNVARLVNYLRTIFATVGYGFLFEPNDTTTRKQLANIISSSLNNLVALRGLYDYLVVCDDSNNTPDRIAQNQLYVDVAIEPMKDVEFIYIPIALFNPGGIASLGK
jgi:hypothetical protein